MKNVLSILLFCVMALFISGCGTVKPEVKKVDFFNKKKECTTYKEKILEDYQAATEDGVYSSVVNKIFYSPKLNSCMFATTEKIGVRESAVTNLQIYDYFSNSIYYLESYNTSTNLRELNLKFENKIKELEAE
ncbi:MAG: hypothetical protein ACD_19C00020G0004 [uncultured bacterium]|nr:MAG: hypothetical protein ACD_19C00020G0004 [uncultured bacterium]